MVPHAVRAYIIAKIMATIPNKGCPIFHPMSVAMNTNMNMMIILDFLSSKKSRTVRVNSDGM